MSGRYGGYLKELLAPLGVYQLEASFNAAELESLGAELDKVQTLLERVHTEADLTTAGEEGLERYGALFARRPVTQNTQRLRAAVAALLRISGDSFTLRAVNDNLAGCGLKAQVREGEGAQTVTVLFPETPGIPDGFTEMQKIIEEILPCHLTVKYQFWYATWAELEDQFATWAAIESQELTWDDMEKQVE